VQTAQLRTQLMGVAALAAQRADPAAQGRIASATAPGQADLDQEIAALSAVRAVVPQIRAIYTMARDPGRDDAVRFVVDASPEIDTDGDGIIGRSESRAEPGEAYPAAGMPDLWLGFDGPAADRAITSDTWGDHLSGYAPIRDGAGRAVAIVGVDLPAEQVAELRRRFIGHALVLAGSTLVAFLAAGLLVAWRMRRPVALLQRGMLAVAAGDLDQDVDIRSGDEFGVLAQAYRRMRDALRRAEEVRRAFDAFVARAAAERSGVRPVLAGDDGIRLALLPAPGRDIAPLLAAVRDGGGAPERLAGEAVVALFPRRHAFAQPQDRALRAALAGLAGGGGVAAVAVTADAAIALARVGRMSGADLLCAGEVYNPVATGSFADRLRLPGGGEAFAVKGPVSS
jgi:HAMP domain-containing protein